MVLGKLFGKRSSSERESSTAFSSAASAFSSAFELCEPFTIRAGEANENSGFLLTRSELLAHAAAVERCDSCFDEMKRLFEKQQPGAGSNQISLRLVAHACQMHEMGLLQFQKICTLTALAALQKTVKDISLFVPKDHESQRRREQLERLSEEAQQMGQRTESSLEDVAVSRAYFQALEEVGQ